MPGAIVPRLEATVERIAGLLGPPKLRHGVSPRHVGSWQELMRTSGSVLLGEIRVLDDLSALPPPPTPVRAAYLVDATGPVIRWLAWDQKLERLGVMYHDHMLRRGDDVTVVRFGYLYPQPDGSIQVLR